MATYDFGSGRTDPDTFPLDNLSRVAAHGIAEVGIDFVLYPGDLGHLGLRQVMAARESAREGVEVDPDHISLMNGSMQAVTLVAEALMPEAGAPIVMEELSYSGTIAAYRSLGAELVPIPVDEHGMRVDALEEILLGLHDRGRPPSFIYTLATYQNPTGSVMPVARRRRLIDVAQRFETVVVEDNCYGDVHFEGPVEPALYALDDDPNLLYIGSLSKILGPGLRQGYLLARPPMLERILARRYDGGNSMLTAAILAEFLRDKLWDHVAHTNVQLRAKRDAVFAALEETVGDICSWSRPVGGLFIWVGFPADVDRVRLFDLFSEHDISCARGAAFHVRNEDIPFLRLAFGYASMAAIEQGVRLVGQCIRLARREAVAAGGGS